MRIPQRSYTALGHRGRGVKRSMSIRVEGKKARRVDYQTPGMNSRLLSGCVCCGSA